jgi:hypothetical protein
MICRRDILSLLTDHADVSRIPVLTVLIGRKQRQCRWAGEYKARTIWDTPRA